MEHYFLYLAINYLPRPFAAFTKPLNEDLTNNVVWQRSSELFPLMAVYEGDTEYDGKEDTTTWEVWLVDDCPEAVLKLRAKRLFRKLLTLSAATVFGGNMGLGGLQQLLQIAGNDLSGLAAADGAEGWETTEDDEQPCELSLFDVIASPMRVEAMSYESKSAVRMLITVTFCDVAKADWSDEKVPSVAKTNCLTC